MGMAPAKSPISAPYGASEDEVLVGLWHCKYSGGDEAGAAGSTICMRCAGGPEKRVHWREDPRRMLAAAAPREIYGAIRTAQLAA